MSLMASLLAATPGCQMYRLTRLTLKHEHHQFPYFREEARAVRQYNGWAHEAWPMAQADCPPGGVSDYYETGFYDGFVDYCFAGGNGKAPLIPPRNFWPMVFRNEYGDEYITEWRAGYEHGAQVARDGGYRRRAILPALDPSAMRNEHRNGSAENLPAIVGQSLYESQATGEYGSADQYPTSPQKMDSPRAFDRYSQPAAPRLNSPSPAATEPAPATPGRPQMQSHQRTPLDALPPANVLPSPTDRRPSSSPKSADRARTEAAPETAPRNNPMRKPPTNSTHRQLDERNPPDTGTNPSADKDLLLDDLLPDEVRFDDAAGRASQSSSTRRPLNTLSSLPEKRSTTQTAGTAGPLASVAKGNSRPAQLDRLPNIAPQQTSHPKTVVDELTKSATGLFDDENPKKTPSIQIRQHEAHSDDLDELIRHLKSEATQWTKEPPDPAEIYLP